MSANTKSLPASLLLKGLLLCYVIYLGSASFNSSTYLGLKNISQHRLILSVTHGYDSLQAS